MKPGDQQSFEAVDENDQVITFMLILLAIDVKRTEAPEKAPTRAAAAPALGARVERAGRINRFARGFQAIGF